MLTMLIILVMPKSADFEEAGRVDSTGLLQEGGRQQVDRLGAQSRQR